MPDSVVIDLQAIEDLRALNPADQDEFLRELVGIFHADTLARIAELDTYLAAGDTDRFRLTAHSIKGSASNLGATALQHAAHALERRTLQEGLAGVAPLLAGLKTEYGRAQLELGRLFPSP